MSDRGGEPVLYQMNADGSNIEKIAMPDMGYVVDPAWSPNGQLLAFAGDGHREILICTSWIS